MSKRIRTIPRGWMCRKSEWNSIW